MSNPLVRTTGAVPAVQELTAPAVPDTADPGRPELELRSFEQHRRLLFRVAYNITGTTADAEDVLQDSWLRWSAASRADVVDPKAYLVQIVSRVALNRLRTVRTQRETYIGPWLPEPLVTDENDPRARVETVDAVSMAMLVVLETLSPLERGVFVLREVFGYSHREVATILHSSETAVRQTARRARAHVQARRPRFDTDLHLHRMITERFALACTTGNVEDLLAILAPDVVAISDGGGKVSAARRPVTGAEKVSRLCIGLGTRVIPGMWTNMLEINGQAAIVAYVDTTPFLLVQISTVNGLVDQIFMVRNPDKLRGLLR